MANTGGPPEHSPYQLFVEGNNDKHALIHLLRRHGLDWDDQTQTVPYVRDCEDVDRLVRDFDFTLRNPGNYRTVAVVLDADEVLQRRWAKLKKILQEHDFAIAAEPPSEGLTAWNSVGLRVGVWLMPDNHLPGSLDDFLGMLVPANDPCWAYSQIVTEEARRLGAPFELKSQSKARIHTWLAWRVEPGVPFGRAITQKAFSTDSLICQKFVNWFVRTFEIRLPDIAQEA